MLYFALLAAILFTNILMLGLWFALIRLEDYIFAKNKKKIKRKHKIKYANYVLKSMHFKNNRYI